MSEVNALWQDVELVLLLRTRNQVIYISLQMLLCNM